jgi:hypothetical protein
VVGSIGLTGTCNSLDADSAVASACVQWRVHLSARNRRRRHECIRANAMKIRWFGKHVSERCECARKEEFAIVFDSERAALQKLALLLTANSEVAKRCLIHAFQECIESSSISKQWVLSWTRRMVIRNAISLVMSPGGRSFVNTSRNSNDQSIVFSPDDSPGANAESESILNLPEFDRFVFVICVLERYSMHDCALLLGRSHRDISQARQRVGNQVEKTDRLSDLSQHFAMR